MTIKTCIFDAYGTLFDVRAVAGAHCDFWEVTQDGLDWALEAAGLTEDPALREDLLALYWELGAYPDAMMALALLKAQGYMTGILSNGSPDMLEGAVNSAGLETLLDAVLSVEAVGVFKPHDKVYGLVEQEFGTSPHEVLFVSSNGWDAAFAARFGFHTVWVNRANLPIDRLPGQPGHVVTDLSAIHDLAGQL